MGCRTLHVLKLPLNSGICTKVSRVSAVKISTCREQSNQFKPQSCGTNTIKRFQYILYSFLVIDNVTVESFCLFQKSSTCQLIANFYSPGLTFILFSPHICIAGCDCEGAVYTWGESSREIRDIKDVKLLKGCIAASEIKHQVLKS